MISVHLLEQIYCTRKIHYIQSYVRGYIVGRKNSTARRGRCSKPAPQRPWRWWLPQSSTRTDVIGPCPTGTFAGCRRARSRTMASQSGGALIWSTHGNGKYFQAWHARREV